MLKPKDKKSPAKDAPKKVAAPKPEKSVKKPVALTSKAPAKASAVKAPPAKTPVTKAAVAKAPLPAVKTDLAKPPPPKTSSPKPSAAKPPAAKPPAAKPPAAKPPASKPPASKPPAAKPPTSQLPTAKPPVAKPPVAKPAGKPAASAGGPDGPPMGMLAMEPDPLQVNIGSVKIGSGDITEKIKELVRIAQEQGYLTYGDINDALADNVVTPDDLDDIYIKLRTLEIDIVDQAEVDRVKQPEQEEEPEDKGRLDILDDPVRMYLKQMGQVPLLTREQEVEISRRIEENELEVRRLVYSFGFTAKEHIALAEKLTADPPRERFDRVVLDQMQERREEYVKQARLLIRQVRLLDVVFIIV